MITNHPLSGVYAAAVTPINQDQSIALGDIPEYLAFLAKQGCHGALLLGTTGEGPSFSTDERLAIFRAGRQVWEVHPDFRLFAGTGTPSLEETIFLTKSAYDLGYTATVVLPPYYFHQATEDGLLSWYQELINRAVPIDGYLLGYHFPAQSRVPIPLDVLTRLRRLYPAQFVGMKDSTTNAEYAYQVGQNLDGNILVVVGNDKLLLETLDAGASGCITAMANLHSQTLREIWESHRRGISNQNAQDYICAQRGVLDSYRPFPGTIKFLLAELHGFPSWSVRPPLTQLPPDDYSSLVQMMREITIQLDKRS
jgi:4-hydroxy-tetrahydrodipicolinate synthase